MVYLKFIQYIYMNIRLKLLIKLYNKPVSEETITKYKEFTNVFSSYVLGLTFVEYKNDQPIVTNVLQSNNN